MKAITFSPINSFFTSTFYGASLCVQSLSLTTVYIFLTLVVNEVRTCLWTLQIHCILFIQRWFRQLHNSTCSGFMHEYITILCGSSNVHYTILYLSSATFMNLTYHDPKLCGFQRDENRPSLPPKQIFIHSNTFLWYLNIYKFQSNRLTNMLYFEQHSTFLFSLKVSLFTKYRNFNGKLYHPDVTLLKNGGAVFYCFCHSEQHFAVLEFQTVLQSISHPLT